MGKHASLKPADAEKGGNFGFPPGSIVTITDCEATTWGEAGEKAITKGRKASDPALKLVGDIEGVDEERPPVFLGAGKSERLEPSGDGEFFDPAEGSSAQALHTSSDTAIFLDTIFYDSSSEAKKKASKAFKMHGKDALPDSMLEDGFKAALIGLKFKAGAEVVRQRRADDTADPKPSLICEEIIEAPTGGKKSKTSSKSKKEEPEEEEEEETPKKKFGKKGKGDDDTEALAEKFGVEALENPKYRKGCASNRFYTAVHAVCKDEDDADAIMKLIGDEDWAQDDARPWIWDKDEEVYKSA